MDFAKRTNKAPEMKKFLEMQLDEGYEEETFVANRLQKTLFLNFDKFKKDCEYEDVRPLIDEKIENRRNDYLTIREWSYMMENLWYLSRDWVRIRTIFFDSKRDDFLYMKNNDLVKEWIVGTEFME
jgi:hypothetical protein